MYKNKIRLVFLTGILASACTVNKIESTKSNVVDCSVSAIMPEFKAGNLTETKATLESVVRIHWSAGDKLVAVNITTGKQLGGSLVAENSGSNARFIPFNLAGTVSAGDNLVFFYSTGEDISTPEEVDFSPIAIDLSLQNGGEDHVPIVAYANYTATESGTIHAENLPFTFLVSYMQLALSALPASTSVTAFEVNNVNSAGEFRIEGGEFVFAKTKGKVKLIDPFTSNTKGAKVRYFSVFESSAEVSARQASITANGQEHETAWIKSAFNAGYYYQSVATGFANENVQFVDPIFKAYCVSHYDGNNDGELSFAEAAAVTSYFPFTEEEKAGIKSVYELPYFPSELGMPSFDGCSALEHIAIPGYLTEIQAYQFRGCSSLKEIHIPDNIESIGLGAFAGCTALNHFSGRMATDDHQFLVWDEHLYAFAQGSTAHVTIPAHARHIEESVFEGCSNIQSLVLNTLSTIAPRAFRGCSNIMSITLSSELRSIGDEAFMDCTRLASVYNQCDIPAELGYDVFANCSNELRVFVSEQSYHNYDNTAWESYRLTSRIWNKIYYTTTDNQPLEFFFDDKWVGGQSLRSPCTLVSNLYQDGEGVLTFDSDIYSLTEGWGVSGNYDEDGDEWWGTNSMFTNQTRLTSLVLPDCLTRLPSVRGCTNLRSISIPESVTHVINWDDNGCPALEMFTGSHTQDDGKYIVFGNSLKKAVHLLPEEVEIPTNIQSIAEEAFRECMSLRKVVIPESIQSIGTFAFRPCEVDEYWFRSVTPPEMPLGLGAAPLWFSEHGKIYVPRSAIDTYISAGYEWTDEYASRIVGY